MSADTRLIHTTLLPFNDRSPSPYSRDQRRKFVKELSGGVGLRMKWLVFERAFKKRSNVMSEDEHASSKKEPNGSTTGTHPLRLFFRLRRDRLWRQPLRWKWIGLRFWPRSWRHGLRWLGHGGGQAHRLGRCNSSNTFRHHHRTIHFGCCDRQPSGDTSSASAILSASILAHGFRLRVRGFIQEVTHLLVRRLREVIVPESDGGERLWGERAHDFVHFPAEFITR